jgi:hypothetical protein
MRRGRAGRGEGGRARRRRRVRKSGRRRRKKNGRRWEKMRGRRRREDDEEMANEVKKGQENVGKGLKKGEEKNKSHLPSARDCMDLYHAVSVCELFDPVRHPDHTSLSGAISHVVPQIATLSGDLQDSPKVAFPRGTVSRY